MPIGRMNMLKYGELIFSKVRKVHPEKPTLFLWKLWTLFFSPWNELLMGINY